VVPGVGLVGDVGDHHSMWINGHQHIIVVIFRRIIVGSTIRFIRSTIKFKLRRIEHIWISIAICVIV
jgi:hypothetical protein